MSASPTDGGSLGCDRFHVGCRKPFRRPMQSKRDVAQLLFRYRPFPAQPAAHQRKIDPNHPREPNGLSIKFGQSAANALPHPLSHLAFGRHSSNAHYHAANDESSAD